MISSLKKQKERLDVALRSLAKSIKAGTITAANAETKLAELRTKKMEIERLIALAHKPEDTRETRSMGSGELSKAMKEKRSITLNGTGAINQIHELAKELQAKTPILKQVKCFYGPNASTNIPILSPSIAIPGNYAEGATTIAADTQATLGNKTITPYSYISLLPISAEALNLGSVNIEGELPVIFSDAFAQGFHNGILTGNGTGRNFKGIFPSIIEANQIECAASGAPKMADLVRLALTIQDLTDEGVIILHSSVYSQIMADATTGVADLYKEALIRDKRIEGVAVILTSGAPNSITAGSVVAAAGRLMDYGMGLASEITIDPIKRPGDSNTYFQATIFANGTTIIDKNWYGLVTK
ncbi:MAG: phage major capsid protein [Treponema sp.]|jgi:HK97 family phage major capsid protein|nr:phage major capsid protein [Treponema sp.]